MRQLLLEKGVDKNGIVTVEGKKLHYLKSVLRVKAGDMVYARVPGGALMQMTVALVEEKRIVLQLAGDGTVDEDEAKSEVKALPSKEQSGLELYLFQFIAKPPKMELIIRQAVECGVHYVIPVAGGFCQKGNIESAKKRAEENNSRWDSIITEALEQSGSAVHTQVMPVMSVQEACEFWQKTSAEKGMEHCKGTVLYEQTAGTKKLHELFKDGVNVECAAVAVGAEGGVMPEEIEKLSEAGFVPIHFDTNILRCETAALYGIAAVQTVIMEKELWQFKE